ncbi:MAG: SpoIID/LytB domain-containing protein, partial [Acidobacteriota bacterium]
MPRSLARKVITSIMLLAQVSSAALVILAQQPIQEETRPRRTQQPSQQPSGSTPVDNNWRLPASDSPVTALDSIVPLSGPEPKIRVGLATDVRTATVSTNGHLMNASDPGNTLIALDVARVRLEARLLSPLPAPSNDNAFRLQVAGAESRAEAEQKAREVREAIGEESQITFDAETKTWGLLVEGRRSRAEAEELSARLNDAGFDSTVFQSTTPPSPRSVARAGSFGPNQPLSPRPTTDGVRLASSRSNITSREVVAFSSGSARRFSSSAPVVLASDDDAKAPVRFNDRPYRGRIEVFANPRGTLTVVNVLGLEDYVRGVVANELSPGGYPALEAQKAQAIAARTYALRNRGQFSSQGFDLLPTTRSQVYRGLASEHPLSTRAVDETRGLIATYNGEPINALYTSTCGGRTEDAENI